MEEITIAQEVEGIRLVLTHLFARLSESELAGLSSDIDHAWSQIEAKGESAPASIGPIESAMAIYRVVADEILAEAKRLSAEGRPW